MIPGLHKLRYLLATRSELVTRICIAVALVSVIGAGFTFANPPTTDVTNTIDRQTITMSLNTQATVEQNSSLYPRGKVLTDMPVYSTAITPNVSINAVTSPPEDEDVRVEQRIALVYKAQTTAGETFWQQTRLLERTNTSTQGDEVVSNATLNIPATERRIDRIESDIGDAGYVTIDVEVELRYDTSESEGSFKDRGEISIRDDSYEIEQFSMQDEYGLTATETRPVPTKISRISLPVIGVVVVPHLTFVFALLSFGGAIGAGVTIVFAPRFDADAEQTVLHAARYAEWISHGTLPNQFGDQVIRMETLEDLVDIAIDSGNRIVYDSSQGLYVVLDAETTYIYEEAL